MKTTKKIVFAAFVISAMSFNQFAMANTQTIKLGNLDSFTSAHPEKESFDPSKAEQFSFSLSEPESNVSVLFSSFEYSIEMVHHQYVKGYQLPSFTLYDSKGKVLETETLYSTKNSFELKFDDLSSGKYLFKYNPGKDIEFSDKVNCGPDSKLSFYTTTVTPVPEPETYSLMAFGMALVGVIARRKRKSA